MKSKRLGQTILAKVGGFIKKAKKRSVDFGVDIFVYAYIINDKTALIMTNYLYDSRKKRYYIDLPLQMILTKTAAYMGTEPYGLSIWNAAFINHLCDIEKK
jgi:hypothetical protein